ncbi:MAG TPA: beta-glucosidase [Thermoanaerobaculia bacterium]|nr:beta-glucosidase [Thermoanaerobaculia bacterium]
MQLKSFWIAGFECSCHCRKDGRRIDLLAATGHDRLAAADYARARALGMETVRDGVRWHRIERSPGRYDFSSLLPKIRAARGTGVQVIWDLCHYGWPEGLDVFRPELVDRFADFARAVARLIADETDEPPFYTPVNEISFWSWAGGDMGLFNPCTAGRGFELKTQLVRASLAAIDAVWSVDPRARILHADPAVHIVPDPERREEREEAEGYREAQFQAWDMIAGRLWPQLGGDERYLDVVGVNYYPYNQWVYKGPSLSRDDPRYRPFRDILADAWERYGRPILIAETGAEEDLRAPWLRYVSEEARAARRAGVPVHGICLYPILDYPGWDDDRHCRTGLWGYPDAAGGREVCLPLAQELARQQELLRREPPLPGFNDVSPDSSKVREEEMEHAAF